MNIEHTSKQLTTFFLICPDVVYNPTSGTFNLNHRIGYISYLTQE